MRKLATALLGALVACGGSSSEGTPEVLELPAPDGRPALLTPGARSPRIANYVIDAAFDAQTRRIVATQTLTWKNTGQRAVPTLPFHLYMNAFKNERSVFMKESRGQHRSARASDAGWGWIDVTSIEIGGEELRARGRHLGPDGDETVLEIPLVTPVEPGATVTVKFAFTVQLPEVFARTGYKGSFTMVGQWFPKIGVRVGAGDAEAWHCKPFHLNSEFFSDFGTYDVTLRVPQTHRIAATGVLVSAEDSAGGTRTLRYQAEDVHDFAWMADPFMKVMTGTATNALGQVQVRVYYRPEQESFAKRHLHAGIGSIEIFSKLYVPYPWAIMSIITPPLDAMGGAGGMEYPTLVTTAGDVGIMQPGIRLPEYVTVHEVGHNWFQGILASNEVEEAWLDEGINEYADSIVMEELYGRGRSAMDWGGFRLDAIELHRINMARTVWLPSPIATPSYAFSDNSTYGAASYAKTALAMRSLENLTDPARLRAAMKTYAERFAFKHPTEKDLFDTLSEGLGQDIAWFTKPVFHGLAGADFRVGRIDCRWKHEPRGVFGGKDTRRTVLEKDAPDSDRLSCDVMVLNSGTFYPPVDVELRFADGTRQRHTWNNGKAYKRIRSESSSRIRRVIIDPDRKVLLNDGVLRSDKRVHPDTAASRRAAARGQFWTQTLMQLGGL